ncbi:MAG: hypothetical protein KKC18_07545, partial [Chloroflexi bacterium]|nr:hypothetical protein [Chloroflexota bacterium]
MGRLSFVDALRGLAAAGMVIIHQSEWWLAPAARRTSGSWVAGAGAGRASGIELAESAGVGTMRSVDWTLWTIL